jgi:uncharacterized membrane protein YdbT with pleckstrin-like domain
MLWRDSVLRFMRVPSTPEPPPGSPPRVFRAAPNFFILRVLRWGLTRLAALAGLFWAVYILSVLPMTDLPQAVVWGVRIIEIFAWMLFIAEAIVGWMIVRLDYEMRWYMVSDRAIRIREGIATVREKTVALANIQNIAIRQGPLQRYLGIADVEVKTAGGGGESEPGKHGKKHGEPMHVAFFRGVDNANEIRDLLREGVRRQRDAGLGDPDEHHREEHRPEEGIPDAAAAMLAEARALRAVAEGLRNTSPARAVPPPA